MTDIVLRADIVIKSLLAAIIVMGGLVWGDLRNQSVKATDAANSAAASSAATLGELREAVRDQDRRIDSLERIVYGPNGGGKFAPPFLKGRAPDRHGPFAVPHKNEKDIKPAPPATDPPPEPPAPKTKREPPDPWPQQETGG